MANILLDHANWQGWGNTTPAPEWNGSAYDFIGDIGTGKYYGGDTLTYMGTIVTGDVASFSIISTSADPTEFDVKVNGSSVFTQTLATGTTYTFATASLNPSDVVTIDIGVGDYLYSQDAVLTPTNPPIPPVAPDETIVVTQNSVGNIITPIITVSGAPVTPTSLTIDTQPINGVASVIGVTLLYTPNNGYIGTDTFTYHATYSGTDSPIATVFTNITMSYNCECDDAFPTSTLAALRQRMVVRLGYAALLVSPPGLNLLINDFLYQAQVLLYRKYDCFRTERWFTWAMTQGQRFYDFGANSDTCTKVMDPRKVKWVGISKGDNVWTELMCGINPVYYRSMQQAIPQFYDIRQCIEVWPAPNSDEWQLRIKGDFGLLPFVSDADVTTIDAEAVFLLALANAKAHYEQPDAGTTMAMATGLLADLTAGQHFTRRYLPGASILPNAVPPLMVP